MRRSRSRRARRGSRRRPIRASCCGCSQPTSWSGWNASGRSWSSLAHAAASEPALAELYRRVHETRLQNLRTIAVALAHRDALRVERREPAETVWALASPELHTLLTRLRGWSRERYIAWLADTLAGALLPA